MTTYSTRTALSSANSTLVNDNTANEISPGDIRTSILNAFDSAASGTQVGTVYPSAQTGFTPPAALGGKWRVVKDADFQSGLTMTSEDYVIFANCQISGASTFTTCDNLIFENCLFEANITFTTCTNFTFIACEEDQDGRIDVSQDSGRFESIACRPYNFTSGVYTCKERDNTTAFQAELDAAALRGDQIVLTGLYTVDATIQIPRKANIISNNATIRQADGANLTYVIDNQSTGDLDPVDFPVLDLTIDGNKDNNTAVTGIRCARLRAQAQHRVRAMYCDVGVLLSDNSERYDIQVGTRGCGTGLRIAGDTDGLGNTPDEVNVRFQGHVNDNDITLAGYSTGHIHITSEGCRGSLVKTDTGLGGSGNWVLSGFARTPMFYYNGVRGPDTGDLAVFDFETGATNSRVRFDNFKVFSAYGPTLRFYGNAVTGQLESSWVVSSDGSGGTVGFTAFEFGYGKAQSAIQIVGLGDSVTQSTLVIGANITGDGKKFSLLPGSILQSTQGNAIEIQDDDGSVIDLTARCIGGITVASGCTNILMRISAWDWQQGHATIGALTGECVLELVGAIAEANLGTGVVKMVANHVIPTSGNGIRRFYHDGTGWVQQ